MNETDHEVMERAFTEPLKRAEVTIRPAQTDDDMFHVADLLVMHFLPEHSIGGVRFSLDGQKTASTLHHVHTSGIILMAVRGGELVGTLGLAVESPWWSSDKYLVDSWFYVRPDARKSRAAVLLLDMAIAIAATQQLALAVSVFNSGDEERKEAFFQRKGLARVGGFFVKGA